MESFISKESEALRSEDLITSLSPETNPNDQSTDQIQIQVQSHIKLQKKNREIFFLSNFANFKKIETKLKKFLVPLEGIFQ